VQTEGPPLLDEVGLSSALRLFLEGFEERSKIKVNLNIPADFERLPPELETAIFRIVQGCLTNIDRHWGVVLPPSVSRAMETK
jgi:signal transduction histidine kinase